MRVFHRTDHAREIVGRGFLDGEDSYGTTRMHSGVWVSDQPLRSNEGATGDTLLVLEIPENLFDENEWTGDAKHYREALIAAVELNPFRPRYLPARLRLSLQQFLRTIDLATELEQEAERCAEAGANYAACLIGACALEAAMLANVLGLEPQMEDEGEWPPSRLPPENWSLGDLHRFHRERGWVPEAGGSVDLGEGLEVVNLIRNWVAHPGRLIREAPELELDEKAAHAVYSTLHMLFEQASALFDQLPGQDVARPDEGAR